MCTQIAKIQHMESILPMLSWAMTADRIMILRYGASVVENRRGDRPMRQYGKLLPVGFRSFRKLRKSVGCRGQITLLHEGVNISRQVGEEGMKK